MGVLSIVVLISGGGSNLRALLEASTDAEYPARVIAVGSDNDAPGLEFAEEFGVPSFTVVPSAFESRAAWGDELLAQIRQWSPDLVVCAGFMRILPPRVVSALSPNLINTHPALLPAFPGAHAVRDALVAGGRETGVTVHIVDEGVDTGPTLVQQAVEILPGDTEAELHERIKTVERALLVQTVLDIANNRLSLTTNRTNRTESSRSSTLS
ncbi:phosphoribosylglycinamide formyltransferase [soil metagenome]